MQVNIVLDLPDSWAPRELFDTLSVPLPDDTNTVGFVYMDLEQPPSKITLSALRSAVEEQFEDSQLDVLTQDDGYCFVKSGVTVSRKQEKFLRLKDIAMVADHSSSDSLLSPTTEATPLTVVPTALVSTDPSGSGSEDESGFPMAVLSVGRESSVVGFAERTASTDTSLGMVTPLVVTSQIPELDIPSFEERPLSAPLLITSAGVPDSGTINDDDETSHLIDKDGDQSGVRHSYRVLASTSEGDAREHPLSESVDHESERDDGIGDEDTSKHDSIHAGDLSRLTRSTSMPIGFEALEQQHALTPDELHLAEVAFVVTPQFESLPHHLIADPRASDPSGLGFQSLTGGSNSPRRTEPVSDLISAANDGAIQRSSKKKIKAGFHGSKHRIRRKVSLSGQPIATLSSRSLHSLDSPGFHRSGAFLTSLASLSRSEHSALKSFEGTTLYVFVRLSTAVKRARQAMKVSSTSEMNSSSLNVISEMDSSRLKDASAAKSSAMDDRTTVVITSPPQSSDLIKKTSSKKKGKKRKSGAARKRSRGESTKKKKSRNTNEDGAVAVEEEAEHWSSDSLSSSDTIETGLQTPQMIDFTSLTQESEKDPYSMLPSVKHLDSRQQLSEDGRTQKIGGLSKALKKGRERKGPEVAGVVHGSMPPVSPPPTKIVQSTSQRPNRSAVITMKKESPVIPASSSTVVNGHHSKAVSSTDPRTSFSLTAPDDGRLSSPMALKKPLTFTEASAMVSGGGVSSLTSPKTSTKPNSWFVRNVTSKILGGLLGDSNQGSTQARKTHEAGKSSLGVPPAVADVGVAQDMPSMQPLKERPSVELSESLNGIPAMDRRRTAYFVAEDHGPLTRTTTGEIFSSSAQLASEVFHQPMDGRDGAVSNPNTIRSPSLLDKIERQGTLTSVKQGGDQYGSAQHWIEEAAKVSEDQPTFILLGPPPPKVNGQLSDAKGAPLMIHDSDELIKRLASMRQTSKHPVWVDMRCSGYLFEEIASHIRPRIHPLTIEDCVSTECRQKSEIFDHYLFISLHMPHTHDRGQTVRVAIIVFKTIIITYHSQVCPIMGTVRDMLVKRHFPMARKNRWLCPHPGWVSHAILDGVVDSMIPEVNSVVREVENVEKLVFILSVDSQSELLSRIQQARISLQLYRHRLWPKSTLTFNLTNKEWRTFLSDVPEPYWRDVNDHVSRMVDSVQIGLQTLESLQNVFVAKVSLDMARNGNRLAEVAGTMGAFGAVFLPMTVVTGVFGMNCWVPFLQTQPFPESRWDATGFVFVMAVMAVLSVVSYVIVERKGYMSPNREWVDSK